MNCRVSIPGHGALIHWLVFHIAGGHAFFSGAALMIAAAVASRSTRPILKRMAVLAIVGIIAVAVSSTALPIWGYPVLGATLIAWMLVGYRQKHRWATIVMIGSWLLAVASELPYHITPTLEPASDRSLTVIGDSVAAGIDDSTTWPRLLAVEHELQVQDLSHVGETTASALKRVSEQEIFSSVVLVEIGGNDLLGPTTSAQFASNLDALLNRLSAPDRQIIMFELPLPPFQHAYGYAQRRIAAKHNVKLIPKRVFLSVIAGGDSTLDSIHLSQAGHQHMADRVWEILQGAF